MNTRLSILSLLSIFLIPFHSHGQEYLDLMNDPSAKMFEIQKAANEYFNKVGHGKGTGYIQYKRWEYENISKSYPTGNLSLSGPDKAKKEFDTFNSKNNKFKSTITSTWKCLGPDNINTNNGHYSPGLGRVDRIAVDPNNANILYIGGPTNGVWKSMDGGLNWVSKTDNVGTLGVSSIVIDPLNTNRIYWSTGDGDNNSVNCTGIYISNDAGETWNISGLSFSYTEGVKGRKLIMHPTENNTLLFSSSKGIYKSIDGGTTWVLKQSGDFDDLFYKTDEPQIVYASKVGEFYRSTNSGESFTKVNIELGGRVFIAITAAAPNVVYLMTGKKGIYKSTDKGLTFSFVADHQYTKGYMWHHGTFIVSPNNENLIHTGEFETHKSLDGGYTWTKTSNWIYPNNLYIHCDIHDFVYAGNKLYVCTDGGVSYTTNEGGSWTNLFNSMVALEPYRMTVCKSNPNLHMNGSQDNGIYLFDGNRWDGIYGADGMDCLIDYENTNNKYFAIQDGEVYATGKTVTQPGRGAWLSPLIMHPTNPSVMYFGNENVNKTSDKMESWRIIGSFGSGNINNLVISESNPDYLYASKGAKLWRTVNEGTDWTEISTGLPNKWITRIAVHPDNPLKVAVSVGGYTLGEKVFISNNGGSTWKNYSDQLPNIEARCLAFDNGATDALYLGMDIGIYYIDNNLSSWELYSDGFPLVGVNDLKIHCSTDQIFAASLGRGVWKNTTKNASQFCSAAGGAETQNDWIKNVMLGSINQSSEKQDYTDFTDVYTKLAIGETHTLQVTLNSHSENDKCFAWIDRNNNKEFENTELITFISFNEQHVATATFSLDENVVPGMYTLRIRNQNEESTPNPCGNTIKGEVEDYSVIVEKSNLEYCNASGASGTTSDWIMKVNLNTIDNTSGKSSYSDFTNISTFLNRNNEYTIKVTMNYHWEGKDKCGAWIDFDQNAEFGENEYFEIPVVDVNSHVFETKFTVPSTAKLGITRMRVRSTYNNDLIPCNTTFGEVEDYSVNISTTTSINIGKPDEHKLKVYPNPANSVLNIEFNDLSSGPTRIYIYDIKGQLVYEEQLGYKKYTTITTSSYESGLYFIKIVTNNMAIYDRFVVQ